MITKPDQTGSVTVKKGDTIFLEGHDVHSLNILLQGKVDVFLSSLETGDVKNNDVLLKSFRICSIDKNIFLGANDLILRSKHCFSFLAAEDCSIYTYPVKAPEQAWSLINSQKDYGTFMVNSLYTIINSTQVALRKLKETEDRLKLLTENLITFFWILKEFFTFSYMPSQAFFREGIGRLDDLRESGALLSPVFNEQFIETDHFNSAKDSPDSEPSLADLKIEYHEHIFNLPLELRKSFFVSDMLITAYHCRDESECLEYVVANLKDTFRSIEHSFRQLYSENSECLYSACLKAVEEMAAAGMDYTPVIQTLEYTFGLIKEIVSLYRTEYCHKCETDLEYIQHSITNLKTAASRQTFGGGSNSTLLKAETDYHSLPEELKDSAAKILEYSALPRERTDYFMMNLLAFRNLKDRLATDEESRNIRSAAASTFFEIYEAVFKKALENKDESRLINMFLNYAYMDERLLTTEQTLSLYRLAGKEASSGWHSVYNMREWLTKVYNMEKDPSINEFGQDYLDIFRELKKRGQVTEKDKPAYESNKTARLQYETNNMLKSNHKLCHGQISVYFPVLHKDMITRDVSRALITAERIRKCLDNILEVDFSAFYRELHFFDQAKGIEKEFIMKSIEPDIVLIPIYGSRSIMWQEITGRNRNTAGRFLLPIFTDEDPDTMLLRLVGNFRWELCRTMMGNAWNDVTQSSLTSEYTDYVQFFKKNRDLSEEAKEKLKAQIVKYHNKTRDIFTADYEMWINNEARGNIRLNKVARGILYRHCPFSRPIREQLERQPAYADLAVQLKNQRAKTVRELESRYNRYIKNGIQLDPSQEHTLNFYRDM